jgi:hypothetical protein
MIYSGVHIYQSYFQFEIIVPFDRGTKRVGILTGNSLDTDNDDFKIFIENYTAHITSTWVFLDTTDITARFEYIGGHDPPSLQLIIHEPHKNKATINKADNVTMRVVWNALIRNGFRHRRL